MFIPIPLMSFWYRRVVYADDEHDGRVYCDYDELKRYARKEALFGAVYWWMVCWVPRWPCFKRRDFEQRGADRTRKQMASTITSLRMADIIKSRFAGVLAIIVMWGYDISEKRAKEIRDETGKAQG